MGFFSWHTMDTDEPIYNKWQDHSDIFDVYMVNPKTGEAFIEMAYDGYGSFGGKDFYVLFAELNKEHINEELDWNDNDKVRSAGINLAFSKSNHGESEGYLYPLLLRNLNYWKNYVGKVVKSHSGQGYWKD